MIRNRLADGNLEVPIAVTGKFRCDLVVALAGNAGIDGHQIVDAVLTLPVAHLGIRIRHCPLELADDGVLIVQDQNACVGIVVRLGHFLGGIL